MKCYKCDYEGPGKFRYVVSEDKWVCNRCKNMTSGHERRSVYGNPADPTKGLVKEPGT